MARFAFIRLALLPAAALLISSAAAFRPRAVAPRAAAVRMALFGSQPTPKTKPPPPPINQPRPFSVRPDKLLDVGTAGAVALLRGGSGAFVQGYKVEFVAEDEVADDEYTFVSTGGKRSKETCAAFIRRPKQPLVIYEFQGCPFCAKVREVVTILDLDVLFLPCPRDGQKFRPEAIQKGGKAQFPYLEDPNTKVAMYESADICQYLVDTYGDGSGVVPNGITKGNGSTLAMGLALAPRIGKGSKAVPSTGPQVKKPIVFWGYEASPFCRLVKEALNELEIPHLQKSCARGSSKRKELKATAGAFLVPYIEDPNTGISMFESAEIIDYLKETYAA